MDSQVLLGRSRVIRGLVEEALDVATGDSKVLITGEAGVGKELLARLIHERSGRCLQPMITINCGSVPEALLESQLFGHVLGSFPDAYCDRRGVLEVADGGTVLLDEVGEMSLRMQMLLLRFLEDGEVHRGGSAGLRTTTNVRVISATSRDLFERTRQTLFREDLYYRLNMVHLIIPPLRARREDISLLIEHYLHAMSKQHGLPPPELTAEALAHLEDCDWTGNDRELKEVAERLILQHSGQVVSLTEVCSGLTNRQPSGAAGARSALVAAMASQCFEQMTNHAESFWTVVHDPFMQRDLMRDAVRAVVRMGLARTRGSYRLVAELFNLPPSDYKRFLSFLQTHDCHMAVQQFRLAEHPQDLPQDPARSTNLGAAGSLLT